MSRDLNSFKAAMDKESEDLCREGGGGNRELATLLVLRDHIAFLEFQKEEIGKLALAISDALDETWWTAGCSCPGRCDGKQKMAKVYKLANAIRKA